MFSDAKETFPSLTKHEEDLSPVASGLLLGYCKKTCLLPMQSFYFYSLGACTLQVYLFTILVPPRVGGCFLSILGVFPIRYAYHTVSRMYHGCITMYHTCITPRGERDTCITSVSLVYQHRFSAVSVCNTVSHMYHACIRHVSQCITVLPSEIARNRSMAPMILVSTTPGTVIQYHDF